MKAQEIIQEALEVRYKDESYKLDKSLLSWLFHREPSESKLKSSAIMHLTYKFIAERDRADRAEQNMYEGIRECIRFIEQREPKEAQRLWQKYLTPQH